MLGEAAGHIQWLLPWPLTFSQLNANLGAWQFYLIREVSDWNGKSRPVSFLADFHLAIIMNFGWFPESDRKASVISIDLWRSTPSCKYFCFNVQSPNKASVSFMSVPCKPLWFVQIELQHWKKSNIKTNPNLIIWWFSFFPMLPKI